ncbi:hypothetical protein [Hyphomicrobium sp.]|jgi:hypothetical protein|uniref:hypothetical protein n=1 Tax=Hyphomicrobium sp. TaxID=82 RepID=UPI002BF6347D|nr:hypothetical protein [Hyphomicrobium sp.]HVZ05241.1 hypothetical protein [Hyphomicrobium sp.]
MNLPEIDLDAVLAEQAGSAPSVTSDATPWIAQSDKGIPLNATSSDTGVSLRTSLDDLRNYNVRTYSIDGTASGAPELPKVATPNLPLDLWTSVDVDGYGSDRDQATRAGIGADYKLSRSASFGISVERGNAHAVDTAVEEDSKASAYMTLQATPLLSLDAKTQWQAGNAEFAAANGAAEKTSVVLAPTIKHSFSLGDGTTLSPFVTYQREFDVSESRRALDTAVTPDRSAGAGITYTDPDSYTLSVTTDVESFGEAQADRSVSSKFNLSVPIN